MPPKLESQPGRNLNGDCSPISTPLRVAPEPLMMVVIVQFGAARIAGLSAAGEDGTSTDTGRPVESKLSVRFTDTGKLDTSLRNRATEKTDCGAKYHSKPRS